MEEYENHPTQKPTSLLKRIVLASSNPGDVVLDPFSGSFTTGDVSKSLDRRFIGIEINEEYVKMGIRRLNIPSSYTPKELEKLKKGRQKQIEECQGDDNDISDLLIDDLPSSQEGHTLI